MCPATNYALKRGKWNKHLSHERLNREMTVLLKRDKAATPLFSGVFF